MDGMALLLRNPRIGALATSAVWASLGAALVIHGCAPSASRPDPAARRSMPPVSRAAEPGPQGPAPAPSAVPAAAPAPEPPKPAYADRPAVPAAEPEVRVRIASLRAAAPAVKLGNPSGRLSMRAGSLPPREVRAPVVVRQGADGWTVTEGSGRRTSTLTVRAAGPIEFHPPAGNSGVVSFDRVDWPGPVRVVPVDDAPGALDLVVDIPMERYLPGVVAKEMYPKWRPEAYRAQAIAARSFAICEHAQWSAVRHYDLVAGEASQAWAGECKDPVILGAVKATRGMVLAFDGRVVPAYYSSCCGGIPANAAEALTRNPFHAIAPLAAGASPRARAACCAASPRYDWSQSLAVSAICSQLRTWSADQLAARDERIERTSPAAPLAARVALDGAAPAPAPAPVAPVRAQEPAVAEIAIDAPLERLASIQGIRSVEVIDANAAGRATRVRLVDSSGQPLEMRAEDFRRAVNYARPGSARPKETLPSSNLRSAAPAGARIEFTGSGFGHGVGMCQFGAQSAAERGDGFAQILARYYPGAQVVKAY